MNIDLYQKITALIKPFIMLYVARRKRQSKEDISRFNERVGAPVRTRPTGKLLWLHGASVGETISMLPLIKKLQDDFPWLNILVTSGTVTSADIMLKRLPTSVIHQYVPIDLKEYTDNFIAYWKPDLALWFESDFWPNLISSTSVAGIPMILVNGRISDRSFRHWRFAKKLIKEMLSKFTLTLGQTKEDAFRLQQLGGINSDSVGNLKYAAVDLPFDKDVFLSLQKQLYGKKIILAASTHEGEEIKIADVLNKLKSQHPSLFLIISPRHPKRGKEIAETLIKNGFKVSLRSKVEPITSETDIYIADTIGEMGLFYHLTDIVFVGGSFVPHGGQNFLEPARIGAAIIVGPYMHNFTEMTQNAIKCNAIIQVTNTDELQKELSLLLTDTVKKCEYISLAKEFARQEDDVLDRVYEKLLPFIDGIENAKR